MMLTTPTIMRLLTWLLVLLPVSSHAVPQSGDTPLSQAVLEPPAPGAHLFEAAMKELRKLPTSHHPLQRRPKKASGIIATTLKYASLLMPRITITAPSSDDEPHQQTFSGPLRNAVNLLHEAALKNNTNAMFMLGEMNFYGNYSHPRKFDAAFKHYKALADHNGNATAQFMLGVMYSTGVGGSVGRDQAHAMLYYTFSAEQGYTPAEMALGFRHLMGIAAPRNCAKAANYYKRAADKSIEWHGRGPPGGRTFNIYSRRITDEDGGVYGRGSSVSSSGHNAIHHGPHSDAYSSVEDVIEYLDLLSKKGDVKSSFNLARMFYEGQHDLERDNGMAMKYFLKVTRKYWKNGHVIEGAKPGVDKFAAKAAGFIGRMYLRGDGMPPNPREALRWFDRGVSLGDAQSLWGRGYIFLHGLGGIKPNVVLATELLRHASDMDWAPAHLELGIMYLDQGDPDDLRVANHYFELAARYGNLDAVYYLAEMARQGLGREKQCALAVGYYKSVAEKAELLMSPWLDANEAYDAGEHDLAFIEYLLAAEQGYEKAQNNIAFMLDPVQSSLPSSVKWLLGGDKSVRPKLLSKQLNDPYLALMYYGRSSRQANLDSLLKLGDYYLFGIGTSPDADKAAQCYLGASEYHQSAQALYNLGWMHENGIGLTQDFHLAKRYYDFALETNRESYLPVTLSLFKLRARSAWNTITRGRIKSIQDEPARNKPRSISEWISNFIRERRDDLYWDDEYDDGTAGMLGPENLYGDDGNGVEDNNFDLDAAAMLLGAGGRLFDGLIIAVLAGTLAALVYYRRVLNADRPGAENRNGRGEEGDGEARNNNNGNGAGNGFNFVGNPLLWPGL